MASKDIHVPDLGDFKDVAVIDVLVQPGETVEVDTPLLTLETEKATMDVPSPEAGVVESVHVQKGSRVSAAALIATLRVGEAEAASPQRAGAAPAPNARRPAAAPAPPAPAAAESTAPLDRAAPAARAESGDDTRGYRPH